MRTSALWALQVDIQLNVRVSADDRFSFKGSQVQIQTRYYILFPCDEEYSILILNLMILFFKNNK